jgi:hypothetical protein
MKRHLTTIRLKKYKYNIDAYRDNILKSQLILPKLHVFEIVFRNKIDIFFKTNISNDWLILVQNRTFPIRILYLLDSVNEVVKRLNKVRKPITNDNILSDLTLGLWVSFFSKDHIKLYRKYNKQQCNNFIATITGSTNTTLATEALIAKELQNIRDFRNRVFHYERITHQIGDIENILDKYLSFFERNDEIKMFLNKITIHKKPLITKGKFRKKLDNNASQYLL